MRDEDSRTKRILKPIVAELGKRYEIETITLDGEDYQSVGRRVLAERFSGFVPTEIVVQAKKIAAADRIVIASPFWDMSYPAILKVFIENMSLFNIHSATTALISRGFAIAKECFTSPLAA